MFSCSILCDNLFLRKLSYMPHLEHQNMCLGSDKVHCRRPVWRSCRMEPLRAVSRELNLKKKKYIFSLKKNITSFKFYKSQVHTALYRLSGLEYFYLNHLIAKFAV